MLPRASLLPLALTLCGCGYVGDPLPPALNIPVSVTDLAVRQTGGRVVISFTLPALTTEQLEIEKFQSVDLRIGPAGEPFSQETWAASAQPVPVPDPHPGKPVTLDLPAGPWLGRDLLASVRLRGSGGRYSAWSNNVTFAVREPLPMPAPSAAPDPAGIRVTWPAIPDARYRVYRQAEKELQPVLVGTVDKPVFTDSAVSLGQTYHYTVQAIRGATESLMSPVASAMAADLFPPSAPVGVVAVAGVSSIELAWERNTETDLASYRVYRMQPGGQFEVLADTVEGIAFADRQAQPGTRYSYQITAVDRSGNESPRSATVSAALQ